MTGIQTVRSLTLTDVVIVVVEYMVQQKQVTMYTTFCYFSVVSN